jgi:outer membrane protein
MKSLKPNGKLFSVFVVVLLSLSSPRGAIAADNPPDTSTSESPPFPRWLLHIDATGVVPHPSADISIFGTGVPGGSLSVNDSVTVTGDASYFFTPNVAVNLYGGVPARGVIKGSGSLSGLGTLATTLYGTAILSAEYHVTNVGAFKPYAGIGPVYTIFLDTHDSTLSNVRVPNAWGIAFSAGADYDISDRWTFHVYVKQMIVSTTVTATLGGAPATSKTTLNPTVFGMGIGYRF